MARRGAIGLALLLSAACVIGVTMETLTDVAKRLLGKAQNEADWENMHGKDTEAGKLARYNMLLFIDMAAVINKHVAECPQCKISH